MPSGLSLPCRSAQHPLGHHLLSLVTPIASSGLDPEDIAHSEVPIVVGQRCPTCPSTFPTLHGVASVHQRPPAWVGPCGAQQETGGGEGEKKGSYPPAPSLPAQLLPTSLQATAQPRAPGKGDIPWGPRHGTYA